MNGGDMQDLKYILGLIKKKKKTLPQWGLEVLEACRQAHYSKNLPCTLFQFLERNYKLTWHDQQNLWVCFKELILTNGSPFLPWLSYYLYMSVNLTSHWHGASGIEIVFRQLVPQFISSPSRIFSKSWLMAFPLTCI